MIIEENEVDYNREKYGGGGGVFFYMGCISMCGVKEYGFWVVLFWYRVWFVYFVIEFGYVWCEVGMFVECRRVWFVIGFGLGLKW